MKTLAIIVNYHSAPLTSKAAVSVLASEHIGSLQVVVVDNSCDLSEASRLKELLPEGVILIVNDINMGFGQACNKAFQACDSDFVLLLNPDAVLLPGCLLNLQQALMRSERIGAAGPRIFWDHELEYHLPPSYPDLFLWIHPLFSRLKWRLLSDCWRYFSMKVWKATHSIPVLNLSGGHVLIRSKAAAAAGGLFDPAFFLYYEDTDLFVRIRQAGYSLQVVPSAKAVHFYDQCDQKNWKQKRKLMADSHSVYMQKHSKGWKKILYNLAIRDIFKSIGNKIRSTHSENIPCYGSAFSLKIPESICNGWLFEWSPNPDFIPSIGKFGTGAELIFPVNMAKLLAPGRYYGRIGDCRRFMASYQFITWVIEESENENDEH